MYEKSNYFNKNPYNTSKWFIFSFSKNNFFIANGNQFFKSKKNNQKFGKLIKNFHENPYNPLNKHLSKTPLSTSQINLSVSYDYFFGGEPLLF
jgi:hypothetical protein